MAYWFVCILCLSLLEVGLAKGTHCPSFFCSFFLSFLLLTSFWRKGHYIRWQMFDFSCPGGFSFLELLALLPVFLSSSIEALVIFASGNFCFRLSANCGGNYLEFFRFRDPSLERSLIDNISHSNSNKWRRIEVCLYESWYYLTNCDCHIGWQCPVWCPVCWLDGVWHTPHHCLWWHIHVPSQWEESKRKGESTKVLWHDHF